MSTRIKERSCPYCGQKINVASPTVNAGALPKKGDISLCIKCGGIHIFDEHLNFTVPTDQTLEEIKKNKKTWGKITAAQTLLRGKNERN